MLPRIGPADLGRCTYIPASVLMRSDVVLMQSTVGSARRTYIPTHLPSHTTPRLSSHTTPHSPMRSSHHHQGPPCATPRDPGELQLSMSGGEPAWSGDNFSAKQHTKHHPLGCPVSTAAHTGPLAGPPTCAAATAPATIMCVPPTPAIREACLEEEEQFTRTESFGGSSLRRIDDGLSASRACTSTTISRTSPRRKEETLSGGATNVAALGTTSSTQRGFSEKQSLESVARLLHQSPSQSQTATSSKIATTPSRAVTALQTTCVEHTKREVLLANVQKLPAVRPPAFWYVINERAGRKSMMPPINTVDSVVRTSSSVDLKPIDNEMEIKAKAPWGGRGNQDKSSVRGQGLIRCQGKPKAYACYDHRVVGQDVRKLLYEHGGPFTEKAQCIRRVHGDIHSNGEEMEWKAVRQTTPVGKKEHRGLPVLQSAMKKLN